MHNRIASSANLAKAILFGLDHSSEKTVIPTPTLKLLLSSLIELADGDNPTARKIESASAAFVASRLTDIEH